MNVELSERDKDTGKQERRERIKESRTPVAQRLGNSIYEKLEYVTNICAEVMKRLSVFDLFNGENGAGWRRVRCGGRGSNGTTARTKLYYFKKLMFFPSRLQF
jgi:hypothetical protein